MSQIKVPDPQVLITRVNDAGRQALAAAGTTTSKLTADVTCTARELAAQGSGAGARILTEIGTMRHGLAERLAPLAPVTRAELAGLQARVAKAEKTAARALAASRTAGGGARSSAKASQKG